MLNNCSEVEEMEKTRTAEAAQVLNFSPVRFEDAELTVGCLPYGEDGKQVLEQLQREHNGTHVFRRDGPDSIVAVSVTANAALIGKPKTIRLTENLGLAAALVRNALLTYLAGMGRTVLSYEPMRFIAVTTSFGSFLGFRHRTGLAFDSYMKWQSVPSTSSSRNH